MALGESVPGPLADVRVLDFSRVYSGPHCGRILADLGADVIKVESVAGDSARAFGLVHGPMSGYFIQQNSGKRSIALDFTVPAAREALLAVVETADVVLENFRPGVMDRHGLGFEQLSARRPEIVYASISGYGQTGVWAKRRAFADVVHAETAVAAAGHRASGQWRGEPISHADAWAGAHCAIAILGALHQRSRTGCGQQVDVAMADAMVYANEWVFQEVGQDDDVGVWSWAPPLFALPDGRRASLGVDPVEAGSFETVVRMIGRPDLVDEPRFATRGARERNRKELASLVEEWMVGLESMSALEGAVEAARLPFGIAMSLEELAATQWAVERGTFAEVGNRGDPERAVTIPRQAWRFSDANVGVCGPAPLLGEHSGQVLAEAGVDPELVRQLAEAGLLKLAESIAAEAPPGREKATSKPIGRETHK